MQALLFELQISNHPTRIYTDAFASHLSSRNHNLSDLFPTGLLTFGTLTDVAERDVVNLWSRPCSS